MVSEILTIGNEILIGSILNTNSKELSYRLTGLGIDVKYHTSVEDDKEILSNVFKIALNRSDIIITTGGLGPTYDDLTKEVIANNLGLELIEDNEARLELEAKFNNIQRSMSCNNIKQAFIPKGAQIIKNENGTAPGIFINKDDKIIIMLPGPPGECLPMFDKYIANKIRAEQIIVTRSINTMGIGESDLEMRLRKLSLSDENIYVATFAKSSNVEIKIIGKGINRDSVESKMVYTIDKIKDILGSSIYGYDNIPLEKLVIEKLREKNSILSICESCTGGNIASKLLSIPGASHVFDRGLVTYSNKSKIDELGVKVETLNKYGAVSREVAYEMAEGLKYKTNSDYTIATTGIAGPDGGTAKKPVGLVYICIMSDDDYIIIEHIYSGNRTSVQERTTLRALFELFKFIK